MEKIMEVYEKEPDAKWLHCDTDVLEQELLLVLYYFYFWLFLLPWQSHFRPHPHVAIHFSSDFHIAK